MMQRLQALSEKYGIGYETMKDVIAELQRPGLDPRDELEPPVFASNILELKDLKIGDKLDGIVRNVTDFGAFVDIGLHNDGLVHKSQMANYFVHNPIDVVKVGQHVKVRVLDIDFDREKVSLSMKDQTGISDQDSGTRHQGTGDRNLAPRDRNQEPGNTSREESGESRLRGNITFS